jgi:hypothetical protein
VKKVSRQYLAGYFDGEGCITIARQARKRADGTPFYSHELRLSIGTTDPVIISEFQRVFGGRIQHYEAKNRRQSPVYQWAIHSLRAIKAINALYPYLITKRSDADIARAYQACVGKRGHGVKITLAVQEKRDRFRLKLIENHGTAARWASAKKSWADRHAAEQAG